MKRRLFTLLGLVAFCGGPGFAAESLDDAIRQATREYAQRLEKATGELNATRTKIAAEERPLTEATTALQDRIMALERELAQLEAGQARAGENLGRSQREQETLKRNLSYISGQSLDALKGLADSLLPGETLLLNDRLKELQNKFEDPTHPVETPVALEAAGLSLTRLTQAMGGYTAPGSSLAGDDNRVLKGTYLFLGPEAYFRSETGDVFGTLRPREGGGLYPVTYALPGWKKEQADLLIQGQLAVVLSDSSGGKALNLRETRGNLLKHIHKGGLVAYLIVGVGALSLVIIILKLVDVSQLKVDEPSRVRAVLALVAAGKNAEAAAAVQGLSTTTRELFSTGLQHTDKSKEALEEYLLAVIQQQRLHFERRLPLLTVIATASPLMGLLGTVMGMIKTFALITVFGTGNAAKLSSGISEVLVTTELGLAVAIPTLVIHGFLAHRIQKDLALLERYAFEFVAAAEAGRRPVAAAPSS